MQHQICQNIEAKFPANSCKVLTAFSIFDVDLLPSQSSPTFSVYGEEEPSCLGKHFFPEESAGSLLARWQAFKFEMIEMKKKLSTLRKQLQANKINFKKTPNGWSLEHILNSYKEEVDFPMVIELAKLAMIIPVTTRGVQVLLKE